MHVSKTRRRVGIIVAIAAALAAFASVAYAATLSNNTKTLPAVNPRGITANSEDLRAWAMRIPANKIGGSANKVTTMYWGDPETTGGGSIRWSKYTVKGYTGYVTVTVRLADAGMSFLNCMATMSGGDPGAAVITSTSCRARSYTIKISFPGEQGRNPSLNLKWYTGVD